MQKQKTQNNFDLGQLLRKYEAARSIEQQKAWNIAWEARVIDLMTDLHKASYGKNVDKSKLVAGVYVELLAAMQQMNQNQSLIG